MQLCMGLHPLTVCKAQQLRQQLHYPCALTAARRAHCCVAAPRSTFAVPQHSKDTPQHTLLVLPTSATRRDISDGADSDCNGARDRPRQDGQGEKINPKHSKPAGRDLASAGTAAELKHRRTGKHIDHSTTGLCAKKPTTGHPAAATAASMQQQQPAETTPSSSSRSSGSSSGSGSGSGSGSRSRSRGRPQSAGRNSKQHSSRTSPAASSAAEAGSRPSARVPAGVAAASADVKHGARSATAAAAGSTVSSRGSGKGVSKRDSSRSSRYGRQRSSQQASTRKANLAEGGAHHVKHKPLKAKQTQQSAQQCRKSAARTAAASTPAAAPADRSQHRVAIDAHSPNSRADLTKPPPGATLPELRAADLQSRVDAARLRLARRPKVPRRRRRVRSTSRSAKLLAALQKVLAARIKLTQLRCRRQPQRHQQWQTRWPKGLSVAMFWGRLAADEQQSDSDDEQRPVKEEEVPEQAMAGGGGSCPAAAAAVELQQQQQQQGRPESVESSARQLALQRLYDSPCTIFHNDIELDPLSRSEYPWAPTVSSDETTADPFCAAVAVDGLSADSKPARRRNPTGAVAPHHSALIRAGSMGIILKLLQDTLVPLSGARFSMAYARAAVLCGRYPPLLQHSTTQQVLQFFGDELPTALQHDMQPWHLALAAAATLQLQQPQLFRHLWLRLLSSVAFRPHLLPRCVLACMQQRQLQLAQVLLLLMLQDEQLPPGAGSGLVQAKANSMPPAHTALTLEPAQRQQLHELLLGLLQDTSPQQRAVAVWAAACWGHTAEVKQLLVSSLPHISGAPPQVIARMLHHAVAACEGGGLEARQVWQVVNSFEQQLGAASARDISTVLHAVPLCKVMMGGRQLHALLAALQEQLQEATVQDVQRVLWSIAAMKAGVANTSVQQLLARFMQLLPHATYGQISTVVESVRSIKGNIRAEHMHAMVDAFLESVPAETAAVPMARLLCSAAVLSIASRQLPLSASQLQHFEDVAVAEWLKEDLDNPTSVYLMLWAMSLLHFYPARLLDAMQATKTANKATKKAFERRLQAA